MIELIYPTDEPAPLAHGSGDAPAEEMLPVVEPSGTVVAQASREWCHGGSMLLHPVVHLHIINRSGEIYLQQRGAHKDLLPLRWDTAVGGHVSYGEYVQEALYREAAEELRFFDFNPCWLLAYEYESKRERELVNVFAAVGDFNPQPDPDELNGGRYWTDAEIREAAGSGLLTPNFESEYARISRMLQSLLWLTNSTNS